MYARYVSYISLLFGGEPIYEIKCAKPNAQAGSISSAPVMGMARLDAPPGRHASQGSFQRVISLSFCRFVHFAIAAAALAVLIGSRAYFLESSILLLGYCLPPLGLLFFLITSAIVSRDPHRAVTQSSSAGLPAGWECKLRSNDTD